MSGQTSYPLNSDIAFAGMKADLGFDRIISKIGEGEINFGRGVVIGTTDDQVKIPTVVATFRGFSVHTHKMPSAPGLSDAKYNDEDLVSVMTRGTLWVAIETSNTPAIDDPVFVNVAIGGAELGKVTDVSVGNIATGAIFREVNTSLKLARVEINLP
jgi:hypothetical protein